MAVNLLASNSAKISFGDVPQVGGLSALTVSLTVKPSSLTDGLIFCSQWGDTFPDLAFILQCVGGDDIGWAVANAAIFGTQTTGNILSTGNTYRIVCRYYYSAGGNADIWVNGVSQTTSGWISLGDVPTIVDTSQPLSVGLADRTTDINPNDGDYSEFAIHGVYMPNDYCVAYGKGYSPAFYRKNGILYAPLINSSRTNDLWGGRTGTNTAGTSAPHPRIIMPRKFKMPAKTPAVATPLRAQIWM